MKLHVNLNTGYDIIISRNSLDEIEKYINLNRNVLVVSDTNIPKEYKDKIVNKSKTGYLYEIAPGENSKTLAEYEKILSYLLDKNFSRSDLIVALGGGVVGDLAGFVAATYKRGIDFINVPTSTLSMVDSSIGGKVAVNLNKIKNVVGAFYQPKLVLIDVNVLKTLSTRHYYNGLVEALKMGLILDKKIVDLFSDIDNNLEKIIELSLKEKKKVVEIDEKETGLRKILNFGHTIGHGIESTHFDEIYHGEAVAMGMLYFISDENLKKSIKDILKNKMQINLNANLNLEEVYKIIENDKKISNEFISVIKVPEIGTYVIEDIKLAEIKEILKGAN